MWVDELFWEVVQYTEEDCLESIRRAARKVDGNLTAGEYRSMSGGCPSITTIADKFGGWTEAKKQAGVKYVIYGHNTTKEENMGDGRDVSATGASYAIQDKRRGKMFGTPVWNAYLSEKEKPTVRVHRLVAIAEFGFDAVVNADEVHHRNHCSLDNRPSNLRLVGKGEHTEIHNRRRSGIEDIPEGNWEDREQYRSDPPGYEPVEYAVYDPDEEVMIDNSSE